MSFVTERDGKGTITVTPKIEAHQSALVVLSHGMGDSAEGLVDVAERFAQEMPYVKFILPSAPSQPVTMNNGMAMPSWYDITGWDERFNQECKGIEESQAKLARILRKEHERTSLPYNRMVLAGFSQGGALSLFTGLQLPQMLAGIVMMSSYLPASDKFNITEGLHDTPIFHCHGIADPVVLYRIALKTQELLTTKKGSTNYQLKTYSGLGHMVSPQELADVQEFLEEILPPDDTCRIRLKDPSNMSVKELKAELKKAGLSKKAKGFVEKSEFIQLVQAHRNGTL